VDACSFWEFLSAREGYAEAHAAPDQVKPPTAAEHDAMIEKWG
jgi:hypothetical protein